MQHFLRFYSLLFFTLSSNFQHTNCSVDVICFPDRLPVIRVVFFLVSKQILRARVFSEQVFVLKIRYVSYVEMYRHSSIYCGIISAVAIANKVRRHRPKVRGTEIN